MPRGIRGRKSKKTEYSAVNAILPQDRDASGKLVTAADIGPWVSDTVAKSAAEECAERQQQAVQAAAEAAAAKAALPAEPKKLGAKQRKRLEAAAVAKEKEAKRLALYASLAQHQAKPAMLASLGSSSTLGEKSSKRKRAEDDDDMDDEEAGEED